MYMIVAKGQQETSTSLKSGQEDTWKIRIRCVSQHTIGHTLKSSDGTVPQCLPFLRYSATLII